MASVRASQGNGSGKSPVESNGISSDVLARSGHIQDVANLSDGASPVAMNRDRIAIFIDGANLFYAGLQMQIEVDYAKLLAVLTQGRQLLRAYFYTGVDRQNQKQQGFILWMQRHGYRVVTKDLSTMPDGTKKANLDIEIAIDMMVLSNHCETLILLSGNGSLAYAVDSITYKGVRVEVVGLRAMTSDSLISVADRYTDLASLAPRITKPPGS
jgi:uncharacterized LabA/DUF88 family protein